ncbi:hypothetical protein ES703_87860 [subsurface metagenome]|nr:trypsin-like serine protease [Dehalococcoidia bacterium]
MRLFHKIMISSLTLVVLAGAGALPLWAQPAPIPHHLEPYRLDSGVQKGLEAETASLFRETVQVPGVPWLRLHFDDYDLGEQSFIRITSLADGAQQILDADSLTQWYNRSAFFNGDAVEVELYVAPGETDVFIKMQEITVGEWADGGDVWTAGGDVGIENICGDDDDRVRSTDPRVGRIVPVGCTGWIVSNGAHLTAGHCTDGTGTDMQTLEFNIPDSLANGTIQHPGPEDQYPIDAGSIVFFNDDDGYIGNDWAVFGCNANSNTGLLPVQGQNAFYRMSRDHSPADVRVTGCGQDDMPRGSTGSWNSDNQTLQTHWGEYLGERVEGSSDVIIEYIADTMGGSSGSPVIIYGRTTTLGIHTNAGCDPPNNGNQGTGFEHDNLENAIQTFPGSNVVYADVLHLVALENGTVFRPYNTVTEAITWVLNNGMVSIVAGSYTRVAGNTFTAGADGKRMTLVAPVGTVTIGN